MFRILNRRTSNGEDTLKDDSIFLATREIQIKTIMKFHLIPVRMAKVKHTNDCLCWRKWDIRRTLLHFWWKWKHVQSLLKLIWSLLRKLRIKLTQDSVIPILGIYPKNSYSYHKNTWSVMFIVALFITVRIWKQHRCSTSKEWIK